MTTLTNDQLLVVAEQLNIQTLPLVFRVGPQQDSYDSWNTARGVAVDELLAAGIMDCYGDIESDLARALYIFAKPEYELLARRYTGEPATRVCVAYRDGRYASGVQSDDGFDIRTLWSDGTAATLTAPILAALGTCDPADISGFSVTTAALAEKLDEAETTSEYTNALYALGAPEREAIVLGAAFSSCNAFTEIVARAAAGGVAARSPGSVTVYDTDRGRIVAAPTVSPDQQRWTTMTTGTGHRIIQAVSSLLEALPKGGVRHDGSMESPIY